MPEVTEHIGRSQDLNSSSRGKKALDRGRKSPGFSVSVYGVDCVFTSEAPLVIP